MKNLIGLLHYLVIAFVLTTPFWVAWYWIVIWGLVYYVVINHWIGYCPLTKWQYGDTSEGFIEKNIFAIFRVVNLVPNRQKVKRFVTYGLPLTVFLTALVWQLL